MTRKARIKCYFLIRQVVAGGIYLYYVGKTGRRESASNYSSGVISSQNCVIIMCPCNERRQNSSCWLAPWLLESGFNQEWQTFNKRGRLCFHKCLSSYWLAEWNTATSLFVPMKTVLFTSLPSSVFVTHSSFFFFSPLFRIFITYAQRLDKFKYKIIYINNESINNSLFGVCFSWENVLVETIWFII